MVGEAEERERDGGKEGEVGRGKCFRYPWVRARVAILIPGQSTIVRSASVFSPKQVVQRSSHCSFTLLKPGSGCEAWQAAGRDPGSRHQASRVMFCRRCVPTVASCSRHPGAAALATAISCISCSS
ncbi:hypothetical protein LSTR_LSTR005826 [Laodelphax striatellus]|uniref:Uncharacterized protein n=1 Tax=Laodelphax striatellus TaxID=195883 RepID=A0A482WSL4_LAOST|nr:hypothetical protein LSTR_LSTR005826 [Laodelphax striatellus]